MINWMKNRRNIILHAFLDNEEIIKINHNQTPAEVTPTIQLTRPGQVFRLIDSDDNEYNYDLTSVWDDGNRWLNISIRVSESFSVQSDCLLGPDPNPSLEEFEKGEISGIRFQPFYLPQCSSDPLELIGRGLFYRGFHFSGTITRGNVSLICICDFCRNSFRLQSFHAGFSNLVYFYCSDGSHTLTTNGQQEGAPPVIGKADSEQVTRFDQKLPSCEKCGGSFAYYNPLLCPHCGKPYIDFKKHPSEREVEYYGNHLWGKTVQKLDATSAA